MIYIGIDNGVSGSIGIIGDLRSLVDFKSTPIKKVQNYTKKKDMISRIDHSELLKILSSIASSGEPVVVILERPMVNPTRFKATTSALRSFESTLVILEQLGIPYEFIDSKEWQKALLPAGVEGSAELKKASHDVGCRLFPAHSTNINNHGDADGLLIAEYCRRRHGK